MNNWIVLGLQTMALVVSLACIEVKLWIHSGILLLLAMFTPSWKDKK